MVLNLRHADRAESVSALYRADSGTQHMDREHAVGLAKRHAVARGHAAAAATTGAAICRACGAETSCRPGVHDAPQQHAANEVLG